MNSYSFFRLEAQSKLYRQFKQREAIWKRNFLRKNKKLKLKKNYHTVETFINAVKRDIE